MASTPSLPLAASATACLAMSAHLTDAADDGLPLTGERTVPGLTVENYWFRRHEVVYRWCADKYAGQDVLEAGCGYGGNLAMLSELGDVQAFEFDDAARAHAAAQALQMRSPPGLIRVFWAADACPRPTQ